MKKNYLLLMFLMSFGFIYSQNYSINTSENDLFIYQGSKSFFKINLDENVVKDDDGVILFKVKKVGEDYILIDNIDDDYKWTFKKNNSGDISMSQSKTIGIFEQILSQGKLNKSDSIESDKVEERENGVFSISEMKSAGIKSGTISTIMSKFNGSISDAVNQWADSGNTKLSKRLTKSLEQLGYNEVFLENKLKLARKQRLVQGVLLVTTAAAAAAYADGGSSAPAGGNDYLNYYSLPDSYDFSSNEIDYSSMGVNSNIDYSPTTDYSFMFDSVDTYGTSSTSIINEADQFEEENDFIFNTPLIFGSSSNYVDGINSYNTGYDSAGMLNIYDSSGITVGAVKDDEDGYGVYKDGILHSYTSKPDSRGISSTYSDGILQSTSRYEQNGDISHYDDSGILTGYSKKTEEGYEHYDDSGIFKSFTKTTDKTKWNPVIPD